MYILILVTTKNKEESEKICTHLLDKHLIACGNIIQNIHSMFWWKDKIQNDDESLILLKTSEDFYESIEKEIKLIHSYENPEIIALPICKGSDRYFKWIDESTKS